MTSKEFCKDMKMRQRLINIHNDSKEFFNHSVADIVTTASKSIYNATQHYANYLIEVKADKEITKEPAITKILSGIKLSTDDQPCYTTIINDDPKAIIPIEKATKLHLLTVIDWHVSNKYKHKLIIKCRGTRLSLKIYNYYYKEESHIANNNFREHDHGYQWIRHMKIDIDALKLYNIKPKHMLQKCSIKRFLKFLDDTYTVSECSKCYDYLYRSFIIKKYGKAKGLKLIDYYKGKLIGA